MSEKFKLSDKGMYASLKDILNFSRPAKNILKIFVPTEPIKYGYRAARGKKMPIEQDTKKVI